MALRPIQRIKHVVDLEGVVDETPVVNLDIVLATDTPVLAQTAQVITGSNVHAIYLNLQAIAVGGSARPNFFMCIFKNPGGNLAALGFDPRAMGSNDNKRFVFHQEMKMLNEPTTGQTSIPVTIFNGVIKIPKGYQRMGPNDKISINIVMGNNSLIDADWCLEAHYKEFR